MDFNVSVGDSGNVMTASDATPTPAGLQAREEYGKVMSDPTHPMFEPFKRRDPTAETYIDNLYKKSYPATISPHPESVSIGGPVQTQPGETGAAMTQINEAYETLSDDHARRIYDATFTTMKGD